VFEGQPQHEAFGDLACELLAVLSGLKRLDILLNDQIATMIQELGAIAEASCEVLTEAVCATLLPEYWRKAAQEAKEQQQQSEAASEDYLDRIHGLFEDLDDAELIVASLAELAPEKATELDLRLGDCIHWFCLNVHIFAPLAGSVEALIAAVRDDLEEDGSAELIATLFKLSPLREEIDDQRFEQRLIDMAIKEGQKQKQSALISSYQPIAAAAASQNSEPHVLLNWTGPNGRWTAFLRINSPSQQPDDTQVNLYISGVNTDEIFSVRLGEVEGKSVFSEESTYTRATFLIGQLRILQKDMAKLQIVFKDSHVEDGLLKTK